MNKKRYIVSAIENLCFFNDKMCFVSGPRQVGKTTLAKQFISDRHSGNYWNWDDINFRRIWTKNPNQTTQLSTEQAAQKKTTLKTIVVYDEIHKARYWKRSLKGIYDTLREPINILVTGSARLDVYQKGSDSLMGRYVPFRLHPLSIGELENTIPIYRAEEVLKLLIAETSESTKASFENLQKLVKFGGFPEPFYRQSQDFLNIWQRTRLSKLVREDLRDLSRLPELSQVEMLLSLLPERASQPISRQTLREDLEVAHTTISRWLIYLSSLYYFYELKPYSKRIKNSLKKEGKLYLWDSSEVKDVGARFENVIANHLLKACHYWTDTGQGNFELHYLKNKAKQEIDFLIVNNKKPWLPIEVKTQKTELSRNWAFFLKQLDCPLGIQLVNSRIKPSETTVARSKVKIMSADAFLRLLP